MSEGSSKFQVRPFHKFFGTRLKVEFNCFPNRDKADKKSRGLPQGKESVLGSSGLSSHTKKSNSSQEPRPALPALVQLFEFSGSKIRSEPKCEICPKGFDHEDATNPVVIVRCCPRGFTDSFEHQDHFVHLDCLVKYALDRPENLACEIGSCRPTNQQAAQEDGKEGMAELIVQHRSGIFRCYFFGDGTEEEAVWRVTQRVREVRDLLDDKMPNYRFLGKRWDSPTNPDQSKQEPKTPPQEVPPIAVRDPVETVSQLVAEEKRDESLSVTGEQNSYSLDLGLPAQEPDLEGALPADQGDAVDTPSKEGECPELGLPHA